MRDDVYDLVYEAVAASLRDFGYPDCTSDQIKLTHGEMLAGCDEYSHTHTVIGAFARSQLGDAMRRHLVTDSFDVWDDRFPGLVRKEAP